MRSHRRVPWRNAPRARIFSQAPFAEIDFAHKIRIGRRDHFKRSGDALAGRLLQMGLGSRCRIQLARPALKSRSPCGASAIVIDYCVAQNATKPRDGRLLFAQPALRFQRAHIGGLQNIFCHRAIVHAALKKDEEAPAQIEE